jgi:hypothetical protein
MDTFELLEELSKKTKYEIKYALVSLMLAGKIDFLDVNSAYIDSLKAINENNFNKLFEAESCVLESFHYKKGNKREYDKKHTQRCLYLLNQSKSFNMADLNEKYEYDEEFGKKMSWYERNKENKL